MYELPAQVKEAANAAARSTGELPLLEISPRQVQRVGARYVAIGDAVAIARIAALFQERRRPYQIREHNLTSFADLRASPAVLIGMFSNAWTLQLGSGFRFVPTIEGDGHHVSIIDRQDPERSWRLPRPWPSLNVSHDYALVSRVVDPATGTLVVSVRRHHAVRDGGRRRVPDQPGAPRARARERARLVDPQPADRPRDAGDRRRGRRPAGRRYACVVRTRIRERDADLTRISDGTRCILPAASAADRSHDRRFVHRHAGQASALIDDTPSIGWSTRRSARGKDAAAAADLEDPAMTLRLSV